MPRVADEGAEVSVRVLDGALPPNERDRNAETLRGLGQVLIDGRQTKPLPVGEREVEGIEGSKR